MFLIGEKGLEYSIMAIKGDKVCFGVFRGAFGIYMDFSNFILRKYASSKVSLFICQLGFDLFLEL